MHAAVQVALALELGKPLFMHCRDAGERFALILREAGVNGSSSAAAAATTTASLAQQPASAAAAASSATIVAPAPAPAQLSLPPPPPGMLHCFTGSAAELEACLELGLAGGITGWVAAPRPPPGGLRPEQTIHMNNADARRVAAHFGCYSSRRSAVGESDESALFAHCVRHRPVQLTTVCMSELAATWSPATLLRRSAKSA